MPPPCHRKKPFSAKQKKLQLKEKRERKREEGGEEWGGGRVRRAKMKSEAECVSAEACSEVNTEDDRNLAVDVLNQQPSKSTAKGYDANRYRLHFQQESQDEINQRKEYAWQPLQELCESSLEIDINEIYHPGSVLDMPKRPAWHFHMSRTQLLEREETYFRNYLDNILEKYSWRDLSYMELNLETWRQLWRVLEMSDIILLITDIRHPALHFSPALYDYVTKDMKKPLIMVLNKIDLAPPSLVAAWQHFFQERFPDIHIVLFTSFPKNAEEIHEDPGKILHKKRRKGVFTAAGPTALLQACESVVHGQVDLRSWQDKIAGDEALRPEGLKNQPGVDVEEGDGCYVEHIRFKDGVLTIGCCGYPNVGKSSLINGLVGRKVVSVSRTPGHTKHFQTIFLTQTVKLCDSPGLVFPSLVSKPLQILAGIYPIAQVREPYTAVGFLAQRIPVPTLLGLQHPDEESCQNEEQFLWSAYHICQAWAEKRGFLTAKAARPDVYRAANSILRLAVEGRLILCMRPPGFTSQEEFWRKHSDAANIAQLQRAHCNTNHLSSSTEEDVVSSASEEKENLTEEEEETVQSFNPFTLLEDD